MSQDKKDPVETQEHEQESEEALLFQEAMLGVTPLSGQRPTQELITDEMMEAAEAWWQDQEEQAEEGDEEAASVRGNWSAWKTAPVEDFGPLAVLSYERTGTSRKLLRKLRKAGLPLRGSLDLHGLTWKQAQKEVAAFVTWLAEDPSKYGIVIHGKGHGAVMGKATMKSMAFHYLKHHPWVVAAISARPKDGGLGALYVLVDPLRR